MTHAFQCLPDVPLSSSLSVSAAYRTSCDCLHLLVDQSSTSRLLRLDPRRLRLSLPGPPTLSPRADGPIASDTLPWTFRCPHSSPCAHSSRSSFSTLHPFRSFSFLLYPSDTRCWSSPPTDALHSLPHSFPYSPPLRPPSRWWLSRRPLWRCRCSMPFQGHSLSSGCRSTTRCVPSAPLLPY